MMEREVQLWEPINNNSSLSRELQWKRGKVLVRRCPWRWELGGG
jgi:hypothetical protein